MISPQTLKKQVEILTVVELKEKARELGCKGYSAFRKKELIKCLLDASSCLYGYKKINGNLRDNSGCLPLELLLWGHGSYNTINKSNSLIITKIIDLMKPYGLEMKIKNDRMKGLLERDKKIKYEH